METWGEEKQGEETRRETERDEVTWKVRWRETRQRYPVWAPNTED